MCRRLIAAGYNVNAFDINDSAPSKAAKAGAVAATSVSACTAQVDLLLTSLPHPSHVETVMVGAGRLGALSRRATRRHRGRRQLRPLSHCGPHRRWGAGGGGAPQMTAAARRRRRTRTKTDPVDALEIARI